MKFQWISKRAERTSRLQRFRSYWVWRRRFENLRFKAFARGIQLRQSWRERRASVGIAGSIGLTVVWSLLAAVSIVVALEGLDRLVFQRSGVLAAVLPNDVAADVAQRFRKGPDAGATQSLFSTVAQIAGIFLGLYFTAVSAIAAAVYADVPGEVRLILIREKVGNVYIRLVAFLGALVLVLLSAAALGADVGLLNVALAGALSALSIFAFVVLGLRAFNFFSPDTLTGYLIKDIVPLIESSRRGAFGARSRAIPYNYQLRAEGGCPVARRT